MENEDFLVPFLKMTPKFHRKPLGLSVKVDGVYDSAKQQKTLVKQRFEASGKVD